MWLKIRPQEPLIVGEVRSGSQFLSSLNYIPGRLLRGAWAERLLAQGHENVLSVVQEVHIGNFFPTVEWHPIRYTLPLPMSALTCKRENGFRSEPYPDNRGHGVVDTLLPQLAYHLLKAQGAQFAAPFALMCANEGCDNRMEPMSGFYTVYRDGSDARHVKTRLRYHAQTKVALSRRRRAAVEGMLYTASALSPRAHKPDGEKGYAELAFLGRVHGTAEDVEALCQAVSQTAIGALHTRGYGRVKVEWAEIQFPNLEDRLRQFNELLGELWADLRQLAANADALPQRPDSIYFSVDLLAPAIFRQHGVPTLAPSLSVNGRDLSPVWWTARPDFAGGWSEAWGLPKPTALAARMGSAYVFHWSGAEEDLLAMLQQLEEQGVGERRDESFGECLICHPFHQEVQEK